MRYRADITAGSLKLKESRIIASLLLKGLSPKEWREELVVKNRLQSKIPTTSIRLGRLLRKRLELMKPELWKMVRDGSSILATQALLAAAIKHSSLLGDFLDLVIRQEYQLLHKTLSTRLWDDFVTECHARDPEMPVWNESTVRRARSTVYQILAQGGYISDTRTLLLQRIHLTDEILGYLRTNQEDYVLRCITVGT